MKLGVFLQQQPFLRTSPHLSSQTANEFIFHGKARVFHFYSSNSNSASQVIGARTSLYRAVSRPMTQLPQDVDP